MPGAAPAVGKAKATNPDVEFDCSGRIRSLHPRKYHFSVVLDYRLLCCARASHQHTKHVNERVDFRKYRTTRLMLLQATS